MLAVILSFSAVISIGQSPTAVSNGQVRDTSGAAIPKATVIVINNATNIRYTTETNDEGIYSVANLAPGNYRIQVSKQGFKTIVHPDIVLHVQDAEAIGFTLPVGPTSDTVTVESGVSLINTGAVSMAMALFLVPRSRRLVGLQRGRTLDRLLVILGLIFNLPQFVVAVLELARVKLSSFIASQLIRSTMESLAVLGCIACVIALLRWLDRTGLLWWPVGWLARIKFSSIDQPSQIHRNQYAELIREQFPMLQMTAREFSRGARLHIWEAWVFIKNPDFVPRHDVEKRIREALMVPDDWPRRGYGPKFVKARLLWYYSKGDSAWTAPEIEAETRKNRATMLKVVEQHLRAHLQIDEKVGNGN